MKIKNLKLKIVFLLIFFFGFFGVAKSANAAEFYWYGGTGTWSDYTNHWSGNSGNSPAAPKANVPTSADNVHFDSNSFSGTGQIVTVNTDVSFKDMNWTGATNTPQFAVGTQLLNYYRDVTFILNMSITSSSTGRMMATGTGTCSLTTNGISIPIMLGLVTGFTGTLNLMDDVTITNYFRARSGTLNTNNHTITATRFFDDNYADTKTWNLGSSVINLSDSTGWSVVAANLTLNAGTSSIRLTGTAPFTSTGVDNLSYNELQLNGSAHTISGNNTFVNLITPSGTLQTITFTDGSTQTISGLATLSGSIGATHTLRGSASAGWNITKSGGGSVTANYISISRSTGSPSTNTWYATNSTDGGNNSGWTINSGGLPDVYWVGGSGNWNADAASHWAPTSGGTGTSLALPTATTNVHFDTNSFSGASQTVTVDTTVNTLNMDWTGAGTYSPTLAVGANILYFYGNATFISAMYATGSSGGIYARNSTTQSLTTGGLSFGCILGTSSSFTGTLNLQDDLTTTNTFIHNAGTITTNDHNITTSYFSETNSNTRTLNLGSSIINVNGASGWGYSGSNLTLNAGTSSIRLTGTAAFNGTGGTLTYYEVQLNGTAHAISGNNTFTNLKLLPADTQTVTITTGSNQTITNFSRSAGTSVITIISNISSPSTLTKAGGGIVSVDYLNISYSTASPANTWYAGTHSTSGTGNSGWIFTDVPGSSYKTLVGKGVDSYQVMTNGTNVYGYNNVTNVVSTSLTSGAWHHVVMTYDGTDQKLYVDGVLQSSNSVTGVIRTNSSNLEIGQGFAGSIDDVRIYSKALSQAEVTAAYGAYNANVVVSDLQKGLVGWWKMNGNAKDSTANSNHGTVSGAVLTPDRKGQANKAYSFDGSSNYIDLGTGLSSKTYPLTFSAWVNPATLAQNGIILNFDSTDANSDFDFGIYNTGNQILVGRATYQYGLSGVSTYLTAGQWSHWVVVFTDPTNITFYLNGAARTLSNISQYYSTDGSKVTIGNRPGASPDKWFNGSIDDVRVYNRALSPTEITALYQEYDPGIVVSDLQKGLVGWWKMDGTAKDATANSNHGTVTGATLIADRKGQANKAYNFNGTTDVLTVPSSSSLSPTSQVTIGGWMYDPPLAKSQIRKLNFSPIFTKIKSLFTFIHTAWAIGGAPPTLTTSAATSVAATTATLNGTVTGTGSGGNPTVTVYWGDNDGGTTPGNWDYNSAPTSPAQPQGAVAFYYDATDLSPGTVYYFSAKATSSAGTGWGTTQTFTTTINVIIGKGISAYALAIDDSLNVTGYISGSASTSTQITKAWHHVVMTYDGANIKLYVDGVLKTTTAKTGAIATNATALSLASNMAGKLDDMRVYSRALSQAEITAWYDSY